MLELAVFSRGYITVIGSSDGLFLFRVFGVRCSDVYSLHRTNSASCYTINQTTAAENLSYFRTKMSSVDEDKAHHPGFVIINDTTCQKLSDCQSSPQPALVVGLLRPTASKPTHCHTLGYSFQPITTPYASFTIRPDP